MSVNKSVHFQIGLGAFVCLLVSSLSTHAGSDECGVLGCAKAVYKYTEEGSGVGTARTATEAKLIAIHDALFEACSYGREVANRNLGCPDANNCELFGVIEHEPKNCAKYKDQVAEGDVDSWENVTVTDGSREDYFYQCRNLGYSYDRCKERWIRYGHRYVASATAEVPVSATQLCRNRNRTSCVVPDPNNIEEILNSYSELGE